MLQLIGTRRHLWVLCGLCEDALFHGNIVLRLELAISRSGTGVMFTSRCDLGGTLLLALQRK
jgi:hypothetical protein